MPILLAVGGSNAIQTLRIDSNTVSVWDKAFQLASPPSDTTPPFAHSHSHTGPSTCSTQLEHTALETTPPPPTTPTPPRSRPPIPDPHRELSYIFQDHLNTGTKLLPVSRGYYFIPGGKGQRLPLPLCISGQHKSVFHDLFCSIANSPLQSLTFLYPSLYLSVGDLVCLGDCVRRSKHLTRLKLPNLKSIESYMPILLAVGGSNAIQTLRIDSNTVSVWDKAFQLAVTSLRHNSTLRTLSLAHWTFDLQVRCESVRKSV
ncbi:hypothetical protein Pcinc_031642 [Petrolisthes cinctipes]|uniref:Uncharacterized protein n=1 Tax=Petrolisthes cinctipes TaxID=88211 RepID=A0AAE1EW58_PETCI|nr:hypothetical protein Pcinc_031642 [Petrolisthes cinctipes]